MNSSTRMGRFLRGKIFQLLCLSALILIITAIIQPGAMNLDNVRQLMSTITIVGVFLCGVAPLLMCGGLDWGGSSIAMCCMILFVKLLEWFPAVPWPVMLIPGLVLGALIGLANAYFIVKLNLMALIITMGVGQVVLGIANWMIKSVAVPISNASFYGLASVFILDFIPLFFIVMVVLVVLYNIMMQKTEFGRSVMMCGGNAAAARLAGLNPVRVRTILYMNSGIIAAIAGIMWSAQNRVASSVALTTTAPHMSAFIGSLIGGVSFFGGSGSFGGAVLGVAMIQLLAYALQSMGAPLWVTTLLNGSLLIIALTIDDISRRIRSKRLNIRGGGDSGGGSGMAVMPGMSK